MTDAQLCHKNKWKSGTLLRGKDQWGDTYTIQLTAVGINSILARQKCGRNFNCETLWSIQYRDWKKVGFKEIEHDD